MAYKRVGSKDSLAASDTEIVGTFDCAKLRTFTLTAKGTFNAAGTGDLRVNIFHEIVDGERDSIAYASFDVTVTQGSAEQATEFINSPEEGHYIIEIENRDAVYAILNIKLTAGYERWKD